MDPFSGVSFSSVYRNRHRCQDGFGQKKAIYNSLTIARDMVHCKGNSVYMFLFWELRGLSPNFYIHVSVSDLYIPRIGPHISSSRNGSSILGIIIRSQTHECGNWDLGPDIPFLGIFASNFWHLFFAVITQVTGTE